MWCWRRLKVVGLGKSFYERRRHNILVLIWQRLQILTCTNKSPPMPAYTTGIHTYVQSCVPPHATPRADSIIVQPALSSVSQVGVTCLDDLPLSTVSQTC